MLGSPALVAPAPDLDPLATPLGRPVATLLERAGALVRTGRIGAALTALETLAPDERPVEALSLLAECYLARGDFDLAWRLGDELVLLDVPTAPSLHTRGELASAAGEPETALELFLAAGRHAAPTSTLPWRSGAALALVRLGRRRDALDLARAHHAVALAHGTAYDVAVALRTLATTDPDGHRTHLEDALALLAPLDAERLVAQVSTDLAGLLVLRGRSAEALALLRSAEAYAAHEHLWPLQSRVRRVLERLGEPPLRLRAEALALLTTAEQRVAVLAVAGMSNRAIAEQLGVSVKAVEGHLSRIYRKLQIPSRAALAGLIGAPAT